MGNEVTTVTQQFRGTIDKMGAEFAKSLPSHIPVEKFQRTVMNAVMSKPDLLTLDRGSLLDACMRAASDGLLLNGKEAALVPFKGKIGYMPMIAGIMKLFRNSGECQSVSTAVVHANDTFDHYTDQTGEHLVHRPNYAAADRGPITLAYALVITKDGGIYIEVMSKAEVDAVRAVSRSGQSGPWVDWYGEMARKTVFRRLSKRLPMSTDLQGLITADDEFDELPTQATHRQPPARPTRLHSVSTPAASGEAPAPDHDAATGEVIEGEHRVVPQGDGADVSDVF